MIVSEAQEHTAALGMGAGSTHKYIRRSWTEKGAVTCVSSGDFGLLERLTPKKDSS